MTDNELKPCPFPHEDGVGQYMTIHERAMGCPFQAHCLICGAMGPVAGTKREAVAIWNEAVATWKGERNEKRF